MKASPSSTENINPSRALQQGTGRTVTIDGSEHLFFGGTAYLGLNRHPEYIRLFTEGIQRYGVNNGTSRTNNVQLGIYDEAEHYLAAKYGFDDTILISSGYLAAQLAVRQVAAEYHPEEIFYSPSSHPALWLGPKPTATGSFEDWAGQTVRQINAGSGRKFLVISNTIDNIIPSLFDFSLFDAIGPDKEVHFILDDSHGLGMLHPDQSTVHTAFRLQENNFADRNGNLTPRPNVKLTIVASMAKGLGVDAGVILGDWETLNRLRQTGVFVGASPTAPAFLHALIYGTDLYLSQWEKLQANIAFIGRHLPQAHEWKYITGYPVFHRPGMAYADRLASNGILISSFPYPDPADPPLDRIVISAAHRQEDLEYLLSLL